MPPDSWRKVGPPRRTILPLKGESIRSDEGFRAACRPPACGTTPRRQRRRGNGRLVSGSRAAGIGHPRLISAGSACKLSPGCLSRTFLEGESDLTPFDLSDRAALVTGCGSARGIGFACARTLAQLGASVAITSTTDRIHERVDELQSLGAAVTGHVCALADSAQAVALAEKVG